VRKIGIIGCGAIGTLIAQAVDKGIIECDQLVLYDYDSKQAERLSRSLHTSNVIVRNVDEMIKADPAVIVEAASKQAARDYVPKVSSKSIDVVVMSVGALLNMNIESERIHISSGAIGGLDAISSASIAGIEEVILTTRKNPGALDMDNREEILAYEGTAEEAVRRFPREMNVAATLALTVGRRKVHVRVISDPKVDRIVHEVDVKWRHGDMHLRFLNSPHPQNPRTSALAAYSAIELIRRILAKQT
jgi:aspartate dehydrogenase